MSRGFLGDEKVMQSANTRNCGRVFLSETTENEDGNDKLWVEVIIVTSLDSDDTVDVLTANDNDVNILYGIWVFHILLLLMVKKGIHYMQL